MISHALVTGADGFVGGILTAHLQSAGWRVSGTTRFPDEVHPERIVCDICDPEQVKNVLNQTPEITHVFHLAALTHVPNSVQNPALAMRINVEGTIHIAQMVRKRFPEARLLLVSSSEVYGPPQRLPQTEDHPLNPKNPYAISKAAADLFGRFLFESEGADIMRVRPFNHTGPGQSDQFVLASFARQIARIEGGGIEPVIHVGNLDVSRDFLHVRDVVRAYERLAVDGRAGEAYNVCSGQPRTIREALEGLLALSESDIRIEVDPARLRPVDVREVRGSHQKLTDDTGWKPERSFADLLAELLSYWREKEGVAA